jgi:hypothetical protein
MILIDDYVGPHAGSDDWNQARIDNAVEWLRRVNRLIDAMMSRKLCRFRINPATGTMISGQTFGGFRPQSCPQGAPTSSHKEGKGGDLYDHKNEIDNAINDALLIEFDLYREHPDKTKGWVHLTTRPPGSKKRTFMP